MNPTTGESCSFCGKSQGPSVVLIEKPGAVICNQCVYQFIEQLQDTNCGDQTERHKDCSFCSFMKDLLSPHDLVEQLKGWEPFNSISKDYEQDLVKCLADYKEKRERSEAGRRLIRGATCSICDECVELCSEILSEQS
jgi:ATP-dependent protease Clp ATPase subunit